MSRANLPSRQEITDAIEDLAQHGVPGSLRAPLIDVGTAPFLDYHERELLDQFVTAGGATCRLFEGPHGAGKSHLLSLLQHRSLGRGMTVVRTTLTATLELEDWRAVTQHILENLEIVVNGNSARGLARILEALHQGGGADLNALKQAKVSHTGFKEAMLLLARGAALSDTARSKVRDYLHGARVGAGELKKLGVVGVKNPLSARNAEQVLGTVINGLFLLGVPGTLLLFDETAKAFRSKRYPPPKKVTVSANIMRRLIDACATGGLAGCLVVFAVLPGFLNNCAEAYPALGQRLQNPQPIDGRLGWRLPVLPLGAVTTTPNPEQFLDAVTLEFERLLNHCGRPRSGVLEQMRSAGRSILDSEASGGYRRPLMKSVAMVAYSHLNGDANGR